MHRPVTRAATAAVNGTYTVQPGDSLWAITACLLVDRSSTAAVARAWPVLYAANRDRIGPDPHLIRPGTVLSVPQGL